MNNRFSIFHPSLTNAVSYERLFSSAGYINKMRSSLDANTVSMLVCLRSWLPVDIWVRKCRCYLLFVTEIEVKYRILVNAENNFLIKIND